MILTCVHGRSILLPCFECIEARIEKELQEASIAEQREAEYRDQKLRWKAEDQS